MFFHSTIPPGRRTRRPRAERGGILVDAMVGIVIAGFVGLAGLSLMMTSASASDGARQTALAYAAARQQIENVRSLSGSRLASGTYSTLLSPATQLAALNNGSGTLAIAAYRGSVRKVTVTILWRSGGQGRRRSLALTTLVTPGGVTP